MQDLGCRVWGVGFMIYGAWFMVYGLWCMVYGVCCMVLPYVWQHVLDDVQGALVAGK